MSSDCVFCKKYDLVHQGKLVFISQDRYPASPGHMLIVPDRHVPDYFDCRPDEITELWQMVHVAKQLVEKNHQPDSYNIGINVSKAAGQSVPHTHIHLIPRYQGDVDDPRGGVRSVIPARRTYVKTPET